MRQGADPFAGRQIALQQHRRDAEHVGDVVEARARIVRGQQRRDVDVEGEQVANRVGVLGAIQAVDERPPGVGMGARRLIERRFQRRDERARARPRSGRGAPGGGIIPARTFRITFSQSSALAGTSARSTLSSIRPPVLSRSLWQVTQYRSTTAREDAAAGQPPPAAARRSGSRRPPAPGRRAAPGPRAIAASSVSMVCIWDAQFYPRPAVGAMATVVRWR